MGVVARVVASSRTLSLCHCCILDCFRVARAQPSSSGGLSETSIAFSFRTPTPRTARPSASSAWTAAILCLT